MHFIIFIGNQITYNMNIIKTLILVFYITLCVRQNFVTANVTTFTISNGIIPFVNGRLKTYVNKIFDCLKINKTFRRSYKTMLLIIMHDNLNNAIEFNWDIYSKLRNSVVVAEYVKNNYFYKLVIDVLKSSNVEHVNLTEAKNITFASTKDKRNISLNENSTFNSTIVYPKQDAKPKKDLFDEFMYQINNLTSEDLIYHPINKTYLEINDKKRYKIFRRKNFDLKTWDPNEYPDDRLSLTRRMARAELVMKYPFIASIHVMEKFTCTGSIISKHAVLTAASCLPFSYDTKMIQQMPDIIQVRVGSDYANHYGEKVPIVDVEFHPNYETKTLKNNIALIRLRKLQKYARSRPKIRKIRLDTSEASLRSNLRNVQILGFGAGNVDLRADTQHLMVVNLDLMPLKRCKDIYSGQFVNDMEFCAGFKASRRNTHCNGDVGAPGVADGHLVGMVSFGPPVCGKQDAPTVFIKIGVYSLWIEHVLNKKFKIPHPGENSGSREFRSTRLFLEEDETKTMGLMRTKALEPSLHAERHDVFKEIKSIMSHMSNPTDHHRYTRRPPPKVVNYDENEEDNPYNLVLEGTKSTPIIQHPLINKSILPIPGIHYPIVTTTYRTTTKVQRPDIGLPYNLPYDYIAERIKTSEELDYFIQLILKKYGTNIPKLPWQRVRTKVSSTKALKDGKSRHRQIAKISKDMQKFRQKKINENLPLHNKGKVQERGIGGIADTEPVGRYGKSKIIGHKITRPLVTLLDVYNR